MSKYFTYHCTIAEIDSENETVEKLLEASTQHSTLHNSKRNAIKELRDILDAHCESPLFKEIERLNRVIQALDLKLSNAFTLSV